MASISLQGISKHFGETTALAYDLEALFGEYIEHKAAVMRDLSRLMPTLN